MDCLVILLPQGLQGHGNHIQVILRLLFQLSDFDHVPGIAEGHIPQREATLLVDDFQHGVDVGVVQHQKALGVLYHMAVLLQNGHAEAMEGVDIARVPVAGEAVNPLAHFVGGFVGKSDAQNVPGQDAQLIDQVGKSPGKRPGFTGARAGNHPDKALRGRNRLPLRPIEVLQNILHNSFLQTDKYPLPKSGKGYPKYGTTGNQAALALSTFRTRARTAKARAIHLVAEAMTLSLEPCLDLDR